MAKLKDGYLKYITANTPGSDSYVLLAGGGYLSYSNSSVANSLVQRDAYGYIVNNYFYTSTGGAERNDSGLGYIAGFNSSDYYIRSYTSAAVKTWLGLGTNAYSSTIYLPLTGGNINGQLGFANITTGTRGLNSYIADNDGWYIQGEGTANNNGALRIGTWDDSNEPIMVSQGNSNTSFTRTAYLLDSSGNTSFPGNVTAPLFIGSLSGNATTSTKLYTDGSTSGSLMTFNWSGQGGQPTWLWGGTDPTNMYVYNPSNFSVNYASTSGSTSTLSYGGLQTMDTSGTLPQGTKFYGVYNNGYPTMYGNVLNIAGQGYGQLLIGWSGTTGAHADNYIRSLRDSAIGTNGWSDWAKILTSANYSSYAIPLSGGTITGSLTVSSTLTANSGIELYGATPYIDFHFNNSASDYTSRIIENTSGILTSTGAFNVNGATTLNSTLGVTGLTTLGGGLLVSSGGININASGLWWKDSGGTTVYSNITSNSSAEASWQVIDANGTEIWFGKRGGKRILSMVTQYDTGSNSSTASFTTIGFGTSIAQRSHTLQVNGDIYSTSSIATASSITSPTVSTIYSDISSNSTNTGWQIADKQEMWFGIRGGNKFMNFTPSSGTSLSEYYVTLGWGSSLVNNGYKLQVNGNLYAQDSIYSDGGLNVVGGITSSNGSLNVHGGITAGANVSANEGYFTGMVQASGRVRAYGGDRGDILSLLFDGYYGYDTVNNVVVSTNYVNKTGVTPTFTKTTTGVYSLVFDTPSRISTILLCIVKDASNPFYVCNNISVSGNRYEFIFQTANDYSRDDAVFRISMLYQI